MRKIARAARGRSRVADRVAAESAWSSGFDTRWMSEPIRNLRARFGGAAGGLAP